MDRNLKSTSLQDLGHVALRKESVDRNMLMRRTQTAIDLSLSARRAWIEMVIDFPLDKFAARRSPQGERG